MADAKTHANKQLILAIGALACAVLLFAGGFFILNHTKEDAAAYTPDQIVQKILDETKHTDLVKVDQSQVLKHYDIPDDVVSASSVYMGKSSESAAELSCFLMTSSSRYDELQKVISRHISTKAAGFKTLNPAQYKLLKDCKIVHEGRYVLVSVGNDNTQAENIFRSMVG